jgi:hypothetical protein
MSCIFLDREPLVLLNLTNLLPPFKNLMDMVSNLVDLVVFHCEIEG